MQEHRDACAERGNPSDRTPKRSLQIAIALTSVIFLAEVIGGLISGSLSLLGDAAHMLQDMVALLLSLGAIIVAERLPTPTRTFGYHRVEIGAAVLNGILLVAISLFIVRQAVMRLLVPSPVASQIMLPVAVVGLFANIAAMQVLHGSHDLNVRSAFLHVMGDTLSSIAVILAAVWIALTGQTIVDPLLGLAIASVILASSYPLLRDAIGILLQFAPRDIDAEEVAREMESVEGVGGVHNLHLWSLCAHIHVLDAHVYSCETDVLRLEEIKAEMKERLKRFGIVYSTLEFEWVECEDRRLVRAMKNPDHRVK
ncbi:MAG: cation diffusion facilitator family transporter [Methanomicrobiales archaeon]|nr:cation diffusion facilitator family transporter [Methanomicrobiales archaeon]